METIIDGMLITTVQLSFLIFLLWLMSRKKKNGRFPYIKERKGADKTDIKIKINKTKLKLKPANLAISLSENEKIFSYTK